MNDKNEGGTVCNLESDWNLFRGKGKHQATFEESSWALRTLICCLHRGEAVYGFYAYWI